MDKLAAVRAGLIHTEHRQEADHRVPCSLCGFPCEPDQLTEVFEDQYLCPECYDIYAASVRRDRARRDRKRMEDKDYDAIRVV